MSDKILVLDFGGQYDQLIARRVREQHVYAEICSFRKITVDEIRAAGYKGIIFTGGPNSVNDEDSPHYDAAILELEIPILGICYGDQLLAYLAGGKVCRAETAGEYGKTELHLYNNEVTKKTLRQGNLSYDSFHEPEENLACRRSQKNCPSDLALFSNIPETSICWMSHMDQITKIPQGFQVTAKTEHCPCAAMCDPERKLFGVQFHPEVTHTEYGEQIIKNFLFEICKCNASWTMEDFLEKSVEKLSADYADKKVLLALSGGVDSSVAAALMHKAVGNNLTCVFVDHGCMRKGEADFVEQIFRKKFGINFIRVNAEARFLNKLSGATDPEEKRKTIGEEFIRVFEDVAKTLGKTEVLCQGTIYPDIVESGKEDSAVIKSHHNVGGLPSVIAFDEIAEPLKDLFKDEVRQLGLQLGLPEELVYRQPFPGPGLAVRIIGEVTKEKLELLREADAVFREEVEKTLSVDSLSYESDADNTGKILKEQGAGTGSKTERYVRKSLPDQYFAVLTDMKSVGVCGDARTYGCTVVLRAVTTDDYMTAEWTRLPYETLERASVRITNEIRGITRVVYDITSKPPATVEWE